MNSQSLALSSGSVVILDTTLRDGEQSPGASLSIDEKIVIAVALEQLGVDVIEAGFPASSTVDAEAVRLISREVSRSTVCAFARAVRSDIAIAGDAISDAVFGRIHVCCPASELHIKQKLNKNATQVLEIARASVLQALEYTSDVEFTAEDAARSDFSFLKELVQVAIDSGASTINLPDTVGRLRPEEYGGMFRRMRSEVPLIEERGIVLSAHCHDDRGLAVANSLAAVEAGASQIECTVNGLGERAGNAAIEEVVMNLHLDWEHYQRSCSIDTRGLTSISRLVSSLTGIPVQPNKSIVGVNAFRHEAGIHQDGIMKDRRTYEIFDPTIVGAEMSFVLGRHSGRAALAQKARLLGHHLSSEELDRLFLKFKCFAQSAQEVPDAAVLTLIEQL